MSYIQHRPRTSNIYGVLGGAFHDQLERIVNGLDTEQSLPTFLTRVIQDADVMGLAFPKDRRGGDSIRQNWIADMTHFCDHFQKPKGEFLTEEFILHPIGQDRYLQGYIDLIRLHGNQCISIYDWKTSSDFSQKDLLRYGRQLIVYGYALEQQGYTVKEVAWIMLKYAVVTFVGAPRKGAKPQELRRIVRRGRLVRDLKDYIDRDLQQLGYDDIERGFMLDCAVQCNTFDPFPPQIRDGYTVRPYVKTYPFTAELVDEALEYAHETADSFESLSPDDEAQWRSRPFVDAKGKEDTFYCNVLCSYRDSCRYILDHRRGFYPERHDDYDDLF